MAQPTRDWNSALATFTAGGVAGAVSRSLTAPLDRIKIVSQEGHLVQQPAGERANLKALKQARIRDVARIIYDDGGVRGFWRGNGINCLKAGPEFALVFTLRHWLAALCAERRDREQQYHQHFHHHQQQQQQQEPQLLPAAAVEPHPASTAASAAPALALPQLRLSSVPRLAENFAVGAVSGASAQLLLYPLEVVKTRIATSRSGEFHGGLVREVVAEAWQNGGIADFYRGLAPNMVGIFLYRGVEIGIFYSAQQRLYRARRDQGRTRKESALSIPETMCIATSASIVAQSVTYPLNVVRTRLQTQGVRGRALRYSGMADCFAQMLRTKGPRALYAGLTANYLKAVPASATTFVVFEEVQRRLMPEAD